jgi:hypothetical protein
MNEEVDAGSRPDRAEITPAGRIAAFVTAGCLAAAGVAFLLASWDELTCRGSPDVCEDVAAGGGLVWILAFIAVGTGAAIVLATRHRPVELDGEPGWTWGLGAVFTAGVVAAAALLPSWTCPDHMHLDANFGLCIGATTRFGATSWTWLKALTAGAGFAIGFGLIRRPRWIAVTAPIAVMAWIGGLGWLLVRTVGPHVGS